MTSKPPKISARLVRTEYWPKPIPQRQFDWIATVDEVCGFGATEDEAILDLIEKLEDSNALK